MADAFASIFDALKPILASCADRLSVKTDTPVEFVLETKSPSPFPQHKGQPLFFGAVKTGKAYVSLHLMPIYMCPDLNQRISPDLKKRMQGKACFNFRTTPEPKIVEELHQLTRDCVTAWDSRKWL